MNEILAGNMQKVFKKFNIKAKKTYESKKKEPCIWQVWELEEKEYDKLCAITDEQWNGINNAWWWNCNGSNMEKVDHRYKINNHYINAWDGADREERTEENKTLKPDDKWWSEPRKYGSLFRYCCNEIRASLEGNICALTVDLAKQNNMKLSELWKKYQP